ncbi:MAG: hypothetical protein CMQ34_11890 [Gammaproteobacteria bacterium]|nr:hypothetical protein [Gammaproteobacteria bacterium]
MHHPCRPSCLLLVCIATASALLAAVASAQVPTVLSDNHYTLSNQTRVLESAEQHVQAGELDAAEIAFRQAFESVRADQGLFHEAQLPVLDRLLATNLARRDWQQFNHYLDYHGALAQRMYQGQPVRHALALETAADWHQRAALILNDELRTWHLIRSRNLIWQAVSALEQTPDGQPRLAPLLYRIAILHYYLTTEASIRGLTSLEVRTDQAARVSGWSMSGNEATRRSYAVGQELLQRIHDMHASEPDNVSTLAQIDTLLGDWQLLFGREELARDYYRRAYQALRAEPGAAPVIEQLFATRVTLPAPYAARSATTPLPDGYAGGDGSGDSVAAVLASMNTTGRQLRPQLTDDFFTEDHQHEFDQVSR